MDSEQLKVIQSIDKLLTVIEGMQKQVTELILTNADLKKRIIVLESDYEWRIQEHRSRH